ncbi:MAG: hypothetical protein AAGD14_08985 [Planctomycetota bacterium]
MGSLDQQARRILDKIELRFGIDPELRVRLHPVVEKILKLGASKEQRAPLLRLVAEAYAHQVRAREVVKDLETKLRRQVTDTYAERLGIEPPNLDPGKS